MECIGLDVWLCAGYYVLVVLDCFSYFIWMNYIVDQTSAAIIEVVILVFRYSGYPSFLFSDNAPIFVSQEMQDFYRSRNITHITSNPHNPQLNGKAESAVKTVKSLLKKAQINSVAFSDALLAYHDTPIGLGLPTPGELMYGHRMKTELPLVYLQEQNTG